MEAASARMASRYQFEGFPPPKSSLQRFIYNACDPISNLEPNLALNLEIVDLVNSKKGSAPREAAVCIVQLINHRNPNVSLLALALLDNCVKNCGYPFHLQISTKEFLNELVRRFPERPPLRPSRVQNKILEAIEEWRATICQTSRYKDDLGFIRDMHRLLLYKGYMFPEVKRDDAAVLNPSDNLKSAEEMEEEEKAAQSAKLQELIRRGTPADLQEANRLMKIMAGYDNRNKTDYRAKAAEEVGKVQQKARILEEMLQSVQEGGKIEEGDVFEELANALQSAHPKIQKMCEEESDDAEAVAKLLEINDSIHRTVERYKLMKAGNVAAANNIPKGTLGTTTGVGRNAANELSLIDFDPEPAATQASGAPSGLNGSLLEDTPGSSQPQQTSVEDDLLGLSIGGGPSGGISLGGPTNADFFASAMSAPSPPPPQAQPQSNMPNIGAATTSRPNYDAFAALTSSQPSSKPQTPIPSLSHQRPPPQPTAPAVDPFAALVSSGSRPGTPSKQQNGHRPASGAFPQSSLLSKTSAPQQSQAASTADHGAEDDWNFVSSPPVVAESNLTVHNAGTVKVEFRSKRGVAALHNLVHIRASFTNLTAAVISDIHFQVAVEKGYTLSLQPLTGKALQPHQAGTITQDITINDVPEGKAQSIKFRFKLQYTVGGATKEEQGMITGLGIS